MYAPGSIMEDIQKGDLCLVFQTTRPPDTGVVGKHWAGSRAYLLSLVAKYVPSPIIMAPVTILCRRRNAAEDRIFLPNGHASRITIRSAEVSKATETVPNRMNCRNTFPVSLLTNCGMKERKNNAVLGLSTSVATPLPERISSCHAGRRRDIVCGEFLLFSLASIIIFTPKKQR